jgi:hypothetical protein
MIAEAAGRQHSAFASFAENRSRYTEDSLMSKPVSYRDAGVNIDEADRAVGAIRKMARATFTKGVLT